jgi:putative MATE family efflux protein
MEPQKARLTTGPVGRHLVDMTLPMLLGITTMMAQSFIDAWFLGRVGDRALAGYSFGFPILMIVTSIAIGLGAGTSSVVARAIGAEDHRRAKRLVTDSLILSFLITATVSAVGVLTIEPLFRLLGAPEDMIPMIRSFMIILYSGVPFVVVGMVGMSSMRATGDTRLPSKLMIAGAILNVILDPIFIFGFGPVPAMGLNGAATAGLLARGAIFVGTLFVLLQRLDMISFNKPKLPELKNSWVDILHVGLPAAGTNAIVPVGLAVITAMIARYGPEAVAGFGVRPLLVRSSARTLAPGKRTGFNTPCACAPVSVFRAGWSSRSFWRCCPVSCRHCLAAARMWSALHACSCGLRPSATAPTASLWS